MNQALRWFCAPAVILHALSLGPLAVACTSRISQGTLEPGSTDRQRRTPEPRPPLDPIPKGTPAATGDERPAAAVVGDDSLTETFGRALAAALTPVAFFGGATGARIESWLDGGFAPPPQGRFAFCSTLSPDGCSPTETVTASAEALRTTAVRNILQAFPAIGKLLIVLGKHNASDLTRLTRAARRLNEELNEQNVTCLWVSPLPAPDLPDAQGEAIERALAEALLALNSDGAAERSTQVDAAPQDEKPDETNRPCVLAVAFGNAPRRGQEMLFDSALEREAFRKEQSAEPGSPDALGPGPATRAVIERIARLLVR